MHFTEKLFKGIVHSYYRLDDYVFRRSCADRLALSFACFSTNDSLYFLSLFPSKRYYQLPNFSSEILSMFSVDIHMYVHTT